MTTRSSTMMARAALAASLLACTGCPGTLDDPERFTDGGTDGYASCGDVPTTVFQATCAQAGCHSTADKAQMLDLQSPNVATRLVNVCSTEGAGILLDPTSPSKSIIYTKLTAMPPSGARMPFGKTPLDDATIACVLAWVSTQTGPGGPCGAEGGAGTGDSGADAPSD